MIDWTAERVDLLTKLWMEGRTASQIAAEIGGGLTRNAVLGKANRLGLVPRGTKVVPLPEVGPEQPSRPAVSPVLAEPVPEPPPPSPLPAPIEPPDPAPIRQPTAGVTIMDLRDAMCRWPLGDPLSETFRYCGSRAVPNAAGAFTYCAEHYRLAYVPGSSRYRAPPTTPTTAAA